VVHTIWVAKGICTHLISTKGVTEKGHTLNALCLSPLLNGIHEDSFCMLVCDGIK
jgi:hypothetical protein